MKLSPIILLCAGLASLPAQALNGYVAELGGGEDVRALRIGMIRQWDTQWFSLGNWHVTGYWDAGVGYLDSMRKEGRTTADIGIHPVFRLRPNASGGSQPYWDMALGVHLLRHARLDDNHDLGASMQLSPLLGVGFTFGDKSQFDLGYRFQHLANAGLSDPDDGLSLHQVRLTFLY